MALNCGGRPPDDHNPKAGLTKKSSGMNMAMAIDAASQPTAATSAAIFGTQAGQMMFAGGSSSSASYGDHYTGTGMSSYDSYGAGGQTAAGYSYEPAQLRLGRSDRYYHGVNLPLQHRQTGGAGAAVAQSASQHVPLQDTGLSDHYHHHHHQGLHSRSQQDQTKNPSSSTVLAAGGEELHERHRGAYYKMGDHDNAGGRTARKIAEGLEARGLQEDEDEEEEEEEEERAEEQSMQYELQAAAAMSGGGGGGFSHGELGASMMSTSSGGGESMSMSMKKRRLTNEQVRSLEVSFERESKLEPERKNELAVELGLQPRQVAVWFQNRRARFKTKQLERDFDLLKLQYDAVRSEKDKLQAQVARLKDLLDAQMATTSKGNTPTTSSEKQGVDDDMSVPQSSPHKKDTTQSMDGNVDVKAAMGVGVAKQSATSLNMLQHAEVFSCDNSNPTLIHVLEAAKSSNKAAITLEVKPSLQVPHINHHHQVYKKQQNEFSNTFSPPTKLSLCSPQQLFLHQRVSMRMEGDNSNAPYHEPPHNVYNQEHYNLHPLTENEEEEYRSDSMICFDSAWHHDP